MIDPAPSHLPVVPAPSQLLTATAFQRLADVPPKFEWFAKIASSRSNLRSYIRKISREAPSSSCAFALRLLYWMRPRDRGHW